MIILAIAVIIKVRNGSKNTFALMLMTLTILMGLANIGWASCEIVSLWATPVVIVGKDRPVKF